MVITKEWLKEKGACLEGYNWFCKEGKGNIFELIEQLKEVNPQWANWLITKSFDRVDNVRYAVFAAEQVIKIFEKKYPKDKRPRKAIQTAKRYIKNPTEKNANAADAAADAANAADAAADAATYAANAAAYAADAAAYAAYAANAADAAADAATYAANAAAYAAYAAAKKEMQIKIINYGIKLLKDKED